MNFPMEEKEEVMYDHKIHFLPIRVEIEAVPPDQFLDLDEIEKLNGKPLFDLRGMRERFEDKLKELTGDQYYTPYLLPPRPTEERR